MQTFMPHDSYEESARALDSKRLGKQRVECKQILRTLLGETAGWKNHPAVLMWKGYEASLCRYAIVVCETWIKRDYNDTLLEYFQQKLKELPPSGDPTWFGDSRFHSSHRSNLLRKDPEYYKRHGWKESPDQPYFWPSTKRST